MRGASTATLSNDRTTVDAVLPSGQRPPSLSAELTTAAGSACSQRPGSRPQADLDIESLQRTTGRTFAEHERADIKTNIQRAYRWTFLMSGLTHPTFVKIVGELTDQGRRRLEAAAEALS
jgi:hypothetical protein